MSKNSPGIQVWTIKYRRTIQLLYRMMREIDKEHRIPSSAKSSIYLIELQKLGILEEIRPNYFLINKENLQKHSVVVSDELYSNMTDLNWAREQRKELNYIKGDIKGPEFRARQQARRKKRKAYARNQKAKHLAQPSEELPLSDIIFEDSPLTFNPAPNTGNNTEDKPDKE